jgi:hypothetical protein
MSPIAPLPKRVLHWTGFLIYNSACCWGFRRRLVWGSGGLGGGAGAKSEESEVQSDRCWAVLFLERARSTRGSYRKQSAHSPISRPQPIIQTTKDPSFIVQSSRSNILTSILLSMAIHGPRRSTTRARDHYPIKNQTSKIHLTQTLLNVADNNGAGLSNWYVFES